jgi:hypothetical protein
VTLWDRDEVSAPFLIDIQRDGRTLGVAMRGTGSARRGVATIAPDEFELEAFFFESQIPQLTVGLLPTKVRGGLRKAPEKTAGRNQ